MEASVIPSTTRNTIHKKRNEKSMVKTWEDLDFDYLKEKWSGERIGCALKIETASRNKW